jgi:hypothetical protein
MPCHGFMAQANSPLISDFHWAAAKLHTFEKYLVNVTDGRVVVVCVVYVCVDGGGLRRDEMTYPLPQT